MKLKVGAKLGLGFGVVLLLMLISAVLTYFRFTDIRQNVDRIAEVRVPSMEAAGLLADDLDYAGNKSRQTILAGTDPARKAAAQQAFDEGWSRVDRESAKLDRLASHWTNPQNRERWAALKEQLPKIRQTQQATMDTAASGVRDAIVKGGNDYADKATPAVNAATQILKDLTQSFDELLKQNQDELASVVRSSLWTMGITSCLALIVGIALAMWIGRGITTTTTSVLHQAEAIAGGDLTHEVKVTSQDELGDLSTAINQMQANMSSMIESIAGAAQQVGNASREVSNTSQQISANSQETSAQVSTVSAATEEVNRNLQTVATATEEMSASIQEIAKNATEAAKVAGEAMKTAKETNTIVSKLGDSSAEIGQVIKVITSIAQKTDLLALNATVEAARAGEVGAGFAVVANEVKELAKQTANATEDISKKIEAIQIDAKGAVEAIKTISGIIDQVNAISSTIATAVEEQSATTSEMSRNLTEAAKGSGEVAQNIHGVAQAAESTSQEAIGTQQMSQQLVELSTMLSQLVSQFKIASNGHGARRGAATAASASLDFASVKAAHRSWRLKLRGFLDGRENLASGKIASHRDCDLGKWLYGGGGAAYGQVAEFQQLEERHKEMHGLVQHVVELKHAGKTAEAEREYQSVCRAADDVVALLGKVETQVVHRAA